MKQIVKPWGYEYLLECNEHYDLKFIFIKKGEELSKQYHEKKHETLHLAQGEIEISYGKKDEDLITKNIMTKKILSDKTIVLEPNTIHKIKALDDTWIIEASTPELDDVVRLEDKYDRC